MTHYRKSIVGGAAWVLSVVVSALGGRASFADDAPSRTKAPAPPAAVPDAVTTPDASAPASTPLVSTPLIGFVERLGPGAFPHSGLYGGSLWSNFHGLQWPYYPKTGIGISGYAWLDSGYEHIGRGNTAESATKYWIQQGRFVLRVTPTWSDGNLFVQAQANLVANEDQSQAQPNTQDTDDLFIRIGEWKKWDVQFGRYEGWEVYHFGMGMDLYTLEREGATDTVNNAPQVYGVNYAQYLLPSAIGQAAVHLYPFNFLRFELGTQFGNQTSFNTLAARPIGVLDFGFLKIKAGAEYKVLTPQAVGSEAVTIQRGVGGSIQGVFDPYVEGGVNFAYALQDVRTPSGQVSTTGSFNTYSVGGFLNVRIVEDLLVGGGYNFTNLEDTQFDKTLNRNQIFRHTQPFVAIQYLVAKRLFVKAVLAYAKADFEPNQMALIYSDQMYSGRVRLTYLF